MMDDNFLQSLDPEGRWLKLEAMDRGMRMAAASNRWIVEYERPPLRGPFYGQVIAFPSGSGQRLRIKRQSGTYYTILMKHVVRIFVPPENEENRHEQ